MSIRHQFQSVKPDGADPTVVRPSDWNATHVIEDESVLIQHLEPAARAVYSEADVLALEMEVIYKATQASAYNVFGYDVGGFLVEENLYTSPAMTTLIFHVAYGYDGSGHIVSKTVTRVTDGVVLTKTYTYNVNGQILSVTRVVT